MFHAGREHRATTIPVAPTLAVLRGVSKTFGCGDTAVHALAEFDLTIAAGELLVVLGPSGSGKTTLLNVLGGIEAPTTGEISIDGRSLAGLDANGVSALRRESLSFVYQFFNLVPTLTAYENIAVLAELTGGSVRRRVGEVLAQVGLAECADRFPAQLSGGQQQRVAIARALVNRPRLLLCDEPTGALDLDTGRSVLTLLQDLCQRDRHAVVLVTHNQAITAIADRVLRMRSGHIVAAVRQDAPTPASEVSW
ncbi:ABC transporter ATP-binding protein [Nocardia sp. CS682]|uniref:ABC transporter ATP-binding protein n=1 Tax=Nocardia sp. CS682 TaxID=1047172 RepID=UPI001074A797|nr:ABC transporter ATP-binding protein [Nocardia sp. CS682]QBS39168.1 macrolide ABC transporter ATP-binding protein [Nocardia sp. CS682]